ncbi:hypothetical protein [Providencia rustigianii]|uniref:hypothetical protein n=1 Tax=Providencia rustigianii TaxID=158850 RepID=UPI0038B391CE
MSNNTRYSASRVFTKNDLITIKKLLREDKNPKEMYQYLANKGDRYALFAGLSGSESGFWGKYTLYAPDDFSFFNYDEKFQEKEFENIDFRLANEYLVLLENKLNQYGGELVEITDISYEELLEINRKACIESWFSIEDWYLYTVFESLSQNEKQGFWTHRLNSSTEFKEQVNHHYKTFDMMIKKYILSRGDNKEIIKSWLTNNFYISMGRTLSDSQFDEFAKIRDSESEISIIMKDAMGSIKTNERVLGDVIPWVFDEVDADEILTEDALLSMGSEVNENILFWETKEEKLKFLMNEVHTNRHNRRRKRSVSFDSSEKNDLELHLKDMQDVCDKVEREKNPQILYDYFEVNNEQYGIIPNGLVKGDSYAGKMATNYLVEKARKDNIILDSNMLKKVQLTVAINTCKVELSKFKNKNTEVLRERLTAEDVKKIHKDSFVELGLSEDYWTLSIPFKIIPPEEHDEIYYEMLLNSGNNQSEVEYGLYLMDKMIISIKNNPSKEKFNMFLEWTNTVSTVDNMIETGSVFGEYLKERSSTLTEYMGIKIKELREVIPQSDLDIYGVANLNSNISSGVMPISHPLENMPSMRNLSIPSIPPQSTEFNFSEYDVSSGFLEGRVQSNHHLENMPSMNHSSNTFDHDINIPQSSRGSEFDFSGYDVSSSFLEGRVQSSHHFENMIGHLSDNMSSMNHSSSSFDRDFSVPLAPSIPEFNYSGGYSSSSSRFSF